MNLIHSRYFITRLLTTLAMSSALLCFGVGSVSADEVPPIGDPSVNDMPVPFDDAQAVAAGKDKYAQRCSFCHGHGDDKGGAKGPCLTCGKFKYGSRNSDIMKNIAGGVKINGQPTAMGAFGSSLEGQDIINIIAFMRSEQRKKLGK